MLDINWSAHNGDLVTTGVKHVKFVEGRWAADTAIMKGQVFTPNRRGDVRIHRKVAELYVAATFTAWDEP